MRLLADEHISWTIVRALEADGHDVERVAAIQPSASDLANIAYARRHDRVILTFDRDYGEHVFGDDAPPPPGIIYVRMDETRETAIVERLVSLLRIVPVIGNLLVVEADNLRLRTFSGDFSDS